MQLPDGSYTIGTDMEAGTYVAEPLGSGCFWARYDASGDTIENDFTHAARVEINVKLSDYSFDSDGCGGWTQMSRADPNSPSDDVTPCREYVEDMTSTERNKAVTPFLTSLRQDDHVSAAPLDTLIARFAKDVLFWCRSESWIDDGTVGLAASAAYDDEPKPYRK